MLVKMHSVANPRPPSREAQDMIDRRTMFGLDSRIVVWTCRNRADLVGTMGIAAVAI